MLKIVGVSRVLAVLCVLSLGGCSDPKPAAAPADPAKAELASKPKDDKGGEKKGQKKKHGEKHAQGDKKGKRMDLGACAASVMLGKNSAVASDVPGTDPLRKVELVNNKQAAAGKSAPLTITVHARAEGDKGKKVVDLAKAKYPAPAQTQAIKLGAISAALTQVAGEKKTDIVTIACDDRFVQISASYAEADAPQRKGFSRLVSSLKVGELKVGEGCPREGERNCAAPMLAACENGKWSCGAPKKDTGKAGPGAAPAAAPAAAPKP
jgi:hypothetical protein